VKDISWRWLQLQVSMTTGIERAAMGSGHTNQAVDNLVSNWAYMGMALS
jgi:hypothetical protein